MNASKEERLSLTKSMLENTANFLEKILSGGPEKEFDDSLEYELSVIGNRATIMISENGEELKLRFLEGEADKIFKDATKIRLPWEFHFISNEGKRVQKKVALVTNLGMDSNGMWMSILPTDAKSSD